MNLKKWFSADENDILADSSNDQYYNIKSSEAVAEDGSTKTEKTLEIFANLNKMELENLYLSGNTGIVDWSIVSSLKWSGKSGF